MADNNDSFFSPEDLQQMVDDRLAANNNRFRGLKVLDQMDSVATELGVSSLDKVSVLEQMKANEITDIREGISKFAKNEETTKATVTPVKSPTRRDELLQRVHESFGGSDDDADPALIIESLKAKLLG